jgi:hypothetical protein
MIEELSSTQIASVIQYSNTANAKNNAQSGDLDIADKRSDFYAPETNFKPDYVNEQKRDDKQV